jgi:DNA-binding transcriptional MerR regulator
MSDDMKIDELSASSGVKPRSIRQYIALGLMSPPSGRTRSATYSASHLADLLTIRKLLLQGMTFAEIKAEMGRPGMNEKRASPNAIEVGAMRVFEVADGVVLMFNSAKKQLPKRTQDLLIADLAVACAKRSVTSPDSL